MTTQLALAFEHAPEPFAILENGMLTSQNKAFRDQLGEAASLSALIAPGDEQALRDAIAKAGQGKASVTLQFSTGMLENTKQTVTLWPAGDGSLALRIESPNQPTRSQLLDSREKLLSWALDEAGGTAWVIRRDGQITLSEGAGLAHYGIKPGQLVGLNAFQIYPEGTDARVTAEASLAGQRLHDYVADSTVTWNRFCFPFRDENDEIIAMVGMSTPINQDSQRVKHAEQLLEIINLLPVIVWAMKADGTCTLSVGKNLEYLGFAPGELVGKNLLEIFKDVPSYVADLEEALKGEPLHTERVLGGERWMTDYFPNRDALGTFVGIYAISQNITEQAAREHERKEQLDLIKAQQSAIASLNSPIIEVWHGVLVVPIIGGVGEDRAASLTAKLLQTVVDRAAKFAILDLTGVDTVDTATAEHLFAIMRSVALLGSTCLVSGIRPNVAATMVSLTAEMSTLRSYPTLAKALRHCLRSGELK